MILARAAALALTPLHSLALIGGTPTWDPAPGAPGINGTVYVLTVFNDGSGPALYAGGQFTSAGGLPVSNLARWNGKAWSPVGTGVDGAVHALLSFDIDGAGPLPASLFIGGNFTHAGLTPANYLARWDGQSIAEFGGGVGGLVSTTAFAPAVDAFCAFDEDGPGPAQPELVVGGAFSVIGSTPALNLARWRNGAWEEIDRGVRHNVNSLVAHEDGSGPSLFVGGSVLWLAGGAIPSGYIGRWNATGWNTLDDGLNAQPLSYAILPNDSRLYMTGNFGASTHGVNLRAVGSWTGAAWQPMSNGLPILGRSLGVYDLGFGDGRQVFAGGHFAMHVWTGAAWQAMPPGIVGAPWYVHALCVYDDGSGTGPALFVAGQFGGVGANIAALRGAPHCPGDANGDRAVNFADLNAVLADFARSSLPGALAGDLNYDGAVTFADLNIVLAGFGRAC